MRKIFVIIRDMPLKEKLVLMTAVIIILICRLWNISDLNGPIVFDDEAGYWGHAANLMGLPWNSVEGAWYSYGYSLLLCFLFTLSHNMGVLYRLAIGLNAIMGVVSFLLGISLINELEIRCGKIARILISFLAVMYSAYMFQAQIAWSETFLYTWFLVVLLTGIRFCKNPNGRNAVWSSVAVFFLYVIHNRALAIIIAYFLMLGYMLIQKKINMRRFANIVFLMIAMVCLNDYAKDYVTLMMLGQRRGYSGNDLASHTSKASLLLSINGWVKLCFSLIGKIWYLSTATFLLAFSGIVYIVKKYIKIIQDKADEGLKYFYFFTIFSILGTLVIATVSTLPRMVDYSVETRLDIFFYGRYSDMVSGILIIFGILNILEFVKDKKAYWESIFIVLVYLLITFLFYMQIKDISLYYVNTVCVPGIWSTENLDVVFCASISVLFFTVSVILVNIRQNRLTEIVRYFWTGILLPMCFICISQRAYYNGIEPAQEFISRYADIYETLNRYTDFPVYSAESNYNYGQALRTRVVDGRFMYSAPKRFVNNFFLIADQHGLKEVELSGTYYCIFEIEDQYLLIKGDKIFDILESDGFSLTEYVY